MNFVILNNNGMDWLLKMDKKSVINNSTLKNINVTMGVID